MSRRWFSPRRLWIRPDQAGALGSGQGEGWGGVGRDTGCAASCRGGPCGLPGVRFAEPSDAVAAGAVAVQLLRDCAVLCWNSPCFDVRSGTPIAVEGPCHTLSGCWVLHPTSHFSGFKGSSGSGGCTSRISRVGLGISSYAGLNFKRLRLCPCF